MKASDCCPRTYRSGSPKFGCKIRGSNAPHLSLIISSPRFALDLFSDSSFDILKQFYIIYNGSRWIKLLRLCSPETAGAPIDVGRKNQSHQQGKQHERALSDFRSKSGRNLNDPAFQAL